MQLQSNKGILFLITGAQGSGKTTIGKKLASRIKKEFGYTIYCDGDILRKIFQFTDYSYEGRKKLDELGVSNLLNIDSIWPNLIKENYKKYIEYSTLTPGS